MWNFYEWIGDLDGNFFSDDPATKTRNAYDVIINADIALALEKTIAIYGMINRHEDGDKLLEIKEKINKAIFESFFDKEVELFKTYSDKEGYSTLANSLCILSGACPNEYMQKVAEKIANKDSLLLNNTLSMNVFKFDALLKADREKYGDYILNEIDQTYSKMLDQGATSFWETELGEADFDNAGSLCHGWSAIPIYYYTKLKND